MWGKGITPLSFFVISRRFLGKVDPWNANPANANHATGSLARQSALLGFMLNVATQTVLMVPIKSR